MFLRSLALLVPPDLKFIIYGLIVDRVLRYFGFFIGKLLAFSSVVYINDLGNFFLFFSDNNLLLWIAISIDPDFFLEFVPFFVRVRDVEVTNKRVSLFERFFVVKAVFFLNHFLAFFGHISDNMPHIILSMPASVHKDRLLLNFYNFYLFFLERFAVHN